MLVDAVGHCLSANLLVFDGCEIPYYAATRAKLRSLSGRVLLLSRA